MDRMSPPLLFYYPAAPNEHKGHLTLLEAARRLALRGMDFRLVFSGAGIDGECEVTTAMRAFLAEHRRLLDGRVKMAGNVPAAEVERLFGEASCVVLPSSYEGFGLPLAEALAFGKPVICSDIAPFREQVARYGCERLATFVPPGNAQALEEAMAAHLAGDFQSMSEEELRERLGRWTWADAAERCRTLLERLHG